MRRDPTGGHAADVFLRRQGAPAYSFAKLIIKSHQHVAATIDSDRWRRDG
jgi:hypothetical protein